MNDDDRFELDLRMVLRQYAGDVSSNLDSTSFARSIALAEPRRRPFAAGPFRWPSVPAGRVGFVLLLLLLLLAAVLAIGVGFRPPVELPAVAPEIPAVRVCPAGSTPNEPGPFEQARPPIGDVRAAVDRQSGVMVAVVLPTGSGTLETWTFDLCSNRWAGPAAGPPVPTGSLPPDLVYDWRNDLTLAIRRATPMAAYDAETGVWQGHGLALPGDNNFDRLVYDPRSGQVLVLAPTRALMPPSGVELWRYDVAADRWAAVAQAGSGPSVEQGDHTLVTYDTKQERAVAVNANTGHTWLLDTRAGVWVDQDSPPPQLNTGYFAMGGELAYDEAAARVAFMSDGRVATYDPVANAWEIVFVSPTDAEWGTVGPQARMSHRTAYDPVNRRLVVLGGSYRTTEGWVDADDVWAFETGAGTWRQLLEASRFLTP